MYIQGDSKVYFQSMPNEYKVVNGVVSRTIPDIKHIPDTKTVDNSLRNKIKDAQIQTYMDILKGKYIDVNV
jgi:hypothetical protein